MSATLEQIYTLNPTTIIDDDDLFYLVRSPYSPGNDFGITGSSLKSIFGLGGTVNPGVADQLAYYASTGNAVSGLPSANNGLLVTNNVGSPSILGGPGVTGKVLQSNASSAPSFSTATYPSVATSIGTLLRADGTNWVPTTSTYPNTNAINTLLYASSANVMSALATVNRASLSTNSTGVPTWLALTDGQIVIGSSAGSPAAASLSAGSGISITPGSNSITIAATNSGTVTSISAGTGITCTPDPITTTGSVSLTIPVAVTSGGTGLTSTTINQILYSSAANTITGLSTANNGLLVTSNTGVPSILAGPGATGRILQSNSSAAPSFSTATYPSVATGTGTILRADGTNWVATTATYPATTTVNQLLYSSAANVISGLATANNGVLITNGSGVPSIATQIVASNLPTGTMFNFQQTQLTTPATFTPAGSWTDITSFSVSITPTSSSNSVLVRCVFTAAPGDANNVAMFRLVRGSTTIGVGTTEGSRTSCGSAVYAILASGNQIFPMVLEWLDSPATTSSTTYKVQCFANTSITNTQIAIGSTVTDSNTVAYPRSVSTISVCEIKA